MDEMERALTDAIRATIEARAKIYAAASVFDRHVQQGRTPQGLATSYLAYLDGQLQFAAESLDGPLVMMRRTRRTVRGRKPRANS